MNMKFIIKKKTLKIIKQTIHHQDYLVGLKAFLNKIFNF